jgi:hypothetical protein
MVFLGDTMYIGISKHLQGRMNMGGLFPLSVASHPYRPAYKDAGRELQNECKKHISLFAYD